MKLNFRYDKEKDIWCLLHKGKSSMNSQNQTKQYEQLVAKYGDSPSEASTAAYVDEYLLEKNIDIQKYLDQYQKDWDVIAQEFTKRAENLFNIFLPGDVDAYLTINSTCPFNIEGNYFFIKVPTYSYVARKTAMHELWHFYTWYRFGTDQIGRLGREKYNDLKEALTVLLNVECADLLPQDVQDIGYPQHQELRQKILEFWSKERDIQSLWEYLVVL